MFAQLKSFCASVEQDSQRIRKVVTTDRHVEATTQATDDFVASLSDRVLALEQGVQAVDVKLFGAVADRLSRPSTNELYEKCLAMYLANQSAIKTLEACRPGSQQNATDKENVGALINAPPAPVLSTAKTAATTTRVKFAEENTNSVPTIPLNKTVVVEPQAVVPAPVERFEHEVVSSPWSQEMVDTSGISPFAACNSPNELMDSFAKEANQSISDHLEGHSDEPDQYQSPVVEALYSSPQSQASGVSAGNPTTPVLASWKLSNATRNLFQSTGTLNTSVNNVSYHRMSVGMGFCADLGGEEPTTPVTPAALRQDSTITNTGRAQRLGSGAPKHRTPNASSVGYSTPQAPHQVLSHALALDATPSTPTMGTPFHSQGIRLILEQGIALNDDELSQSSDVKVNGVGDEVSAPIASTTTTTVVFESASALDDSLLDQSGSSVSFDSPPKIAILAGMRSGQTSISQADAIQSTIASPVISTIPWLQSGEWETAPSFLRMQASLDVLNNAITKINDFLLANPETTGLPLPLLESMFAGNATPVKVILLGLVQMKRMDLGCERGVKVYKLRN